MNLIEEVESKRGTHQADDLVYGPWWPRIKAALEAAQGMEVCLDVIAKLMGEEPTKATIERSRFRAAFEGKE